MKKGILFTIVILLMMICSMVSAQESESSSNDEALRKEGRPRISVKTFENPSMYYNSSIGTGVTDMLITILVQSGRFNVIARNESFEELKDEIDLGESGYIEEETKVEKGKIKGVDYILMGKVTNFGYKSNSGGLGGVVPGGWGDVDIKNQKAVVWIDFRLVDAKTGEAIIAESAEGVEKKSGVSLGGSDFGNWVGRIRFDSDEFRDSMVGKATVKAIDALAEKIIDHFPLTGAVIAVAGDRIIIDLGEGAGISAGQKFKVISESVIRNDEGEVVFREETEIGTVEVSEVQLKSSMMRIVSGCSGIKEGNIVRALDEKKEDKDKKKDKDEDD
ncbi:MAG: CsgG/HfaB family protein [bacterium]